LEKGQFYLDGRRLDEFIKKLISKAESEIIIVNPNVNECALSDTLKESCKRGITVKLITRPPDEVKSLYGWYKKEYHSSLKKAGITVRYNNNVHAKMITVDRAIAIISSIDFCHYSVGNSFDAGIISLEETVIELIINSILKIFELSDTKADIKKLNDH